MTPMKQTGLKKRWISVGRLDSGKGFNELLRVWAAQSLEFLSLNQLMIVGEGPEEPSFSQFIQEQFQGENVILAGFKTPEELALLYQDADVFIFPSLKDTWGLVVNEAMASGLPIICSKYAGCCSDLIKKENGVVIDPLCANSFAVAVNEFWMRRERWKEMGEKSLQIIAGYTIDVTAEAIVASARGALESSARKMD